MRAGKRDPLLMLAVRIVALGVVVGSNPSRDKWPEIAMVYHSSGSPSVSYPLVRLIVVWCDKSYSNHQ